MEGQNIIFRKLEQEEIQTALKLAWKVFSEYESPDYSEEGTEEFKKAFSEALNLECGCVIDCNIDIDEMVRPMVGGGSHITDFMIN